MEFIFVGLSQRSGRIMGARAASYSKNPFEIEYSDGFLSPALPVAADLVPAADQAKKDPEAWPKALVEIMKAQRDRALTLRQADIKAGKRPRHELIGGAAELTRMDTSGVITQRVIHRWPDRLYEAISPDS